MALRFILNLNAKATLGQNVFVTLPDQSEVSIKHGAQLHGQYDQELGLFWISIAGSVASINTGETCIEIEEYEAETA